MAEYKKPVSEAEFEQNFAQLKPLMNNTEAYYESSRCLFCYDAPCMNACPTSIDIPLFIRQINSGNLDGAAKTIYNSNYFGHACGKVCPTEVLCEGDCVYTGQDIKPVEIGRLQAFATSNAIRNNKILFDLAPSNGKKVAVIGAGPGGIACACELRTKGYAVDIYEAKSKPSGLTVHGVAPYKITNKEVLDEMAYLQEQFGFEIAYDSKVSTREHIETLEREYDAIFLGIGLGNTNILRIPGNEKQNCFGATEFIEKLRNNHNEVEVPASVVVIGGGNTAMDAASECARMGAEKVVLFYRGAREHMSAYEFEYDLAKSVGVKGVFNAQPVEIVGGTHVEGVHFQRTRQENGSVSNVPGSDFMVECDMVIMATGQHKQVEFLSLIDGLQTDEKGRIVVNEYFQCTNEKYFAGGDAVNGGAEVVNAAADGKAAALAIDEFLTK